MADNQQPATPQPPAGQNPQQSGQPQNPAQQSPASGQQQPPMQQAGSTQQPQPPQAQQPSDPNSRTGQLSKKSGFFVMPPHPNTTFDENYFLELLEGSISLTLDEKKKVIEAIPRLSIEQINELIKIFEEEKVKFAELEGQYSSDVDKLKKEREQEIELAKVQQEEQKAEEGNEDEVANLKAGLDL